MPLEEAVQWAWDVFHGKSVLENVNAIFPDHQYVSKSLDAESWIRSHLHQKPFYLVMRKDKVSECLNILNDSNIPYKIYDDILLKLPADSKADVLVDNGWAWVMDRASAAIANKVEIKTSQTVWDACCGAGGKSLYLSQKYDGKFDLICSDLRFSVTENLKQRFNLLNFNIPRVELTDLTEAFQLDKMMDVIVLDVPCTGSGTWGRSPENIATFQVSSISTYAKLQRKIASNAMRNLKKGGSLYYMTCSVFDEENEKNVQLISESHGLKVVDSAYVHFGHTETDTLYFAHLML